MNEAARTPVTVQALQQRPDVVGDLICDVASGDVAAYARLYDSVAPLVYGVARKVVRDPALAEEIAQEVLLAVWQQACKFDRAAGSGRTWIVMIAHRRAIDRVRSEHAARRRNLRFGHNSQGRPFDEVVELIETRADHAAVADALAALTALQRQAVTLAYFGGYTYREVAQMLDAPLATVKTRIRDGLVRLRCHLETSGALVISG